jgi:KaiC/GvpD/RAD55 family RecA-like ATPase
MLRIVERVTEQPAPKVREEPSPTGTVQAEKPQTAPNYSSDKQRRALEDREKELLLKERGLLEKEKEVLAVTDSLEKDAISLEEALRKFEMEKKALQERQMMVMEMEEHILDLTERVEDSFSELSGLVEQGRTGELGPEERLLAEVLKKRFVQTYETERRRLRKKIEESNVFDIGKIIELEARLRSAEGQVNQMRDQMTMRDEMVQAPIKFLPDPKMIREIEKEIDDQIGIGYVDSEKGQPVPTHIEKLDSILGGGIPSGHLILVSGGPGTMKSTMTYNILFNHAKMDKGNCLYFSLEQSRESLVRQMERIGMPTQDIGDKLTVVDMVGLRRSMQGEPGDWRSILLRYVKNIHAQRHFSMFVLDSLESFKSVTSYDFSRQELKDLFDWFKELGITVFLIAEAAPVHSDNTSQEMYLADGIIELRLKDIDDAKVQRWLRIPKMRGMNVDTRFYAIFHNNQHFVMTMPIVEIVHHPHPSR